MLGHNSLLKNRDWLRPTSKVAWTSLLNQVPVPLFQHADKSYRILHEQTRDSTSMAPAASSLRPICNIDVQDKIITVQHPCHMSLSAAKLQAVEQQNHNRYTLTARIQTVKRILRIHAAFYEKYPLVLERLKSVVLQFWHTAQISSTLVPEIGSAIKRDLTPPVTNMFLMRTCAAISESVF